MFKVLESYNVNSKIFTRVYFHKNSQMQSFVKINPSRNYSVFLWIEVNLALVTNVNVTNVSLTLFRKIEFSRKFLNI